MSSLKTIKAGMSGGDWFNPKDRKHVESFCEYIRDGEDWPDNGTKPDDIFMHSLWEQRAIQLMALEYIELMLNGGI